MKVFVIVSSFDGETEFKGCYSSKKKALHNATDDPSSVLVDESPLDYPDTCRQYAVYNDGVHLGYYNIIETEVE